MVLATVLMTVVNKEKHRAGLMDDQMDDQKAEKLVGSQDIEQVVYLVYEMAVMKVDRMELHYVQKMEAQQVVKTADYSAVQTGKRQVYKLVAGKVERKVLRRDMILVDTRVVHLVALWVGRKVVKLEKQMAVYLDYEKAEKMVVSMDDFLVALLAEMKALRQGEKTDVWMVAERVELMVGLMVVVWDDWKVEQMIAMWVEWKVGQMIAVWVARKVG